MPHSSDLRTTGQALRSTVPLSFQSSSNKSNEMLPQYRLLHWSVSTHSAIQDLTMYVYNDPSFALSSAPSECRFWAYGVLQGRVKNMIHGRFLANRLFIAGRFLADGP